MLSRPELERLGYAVPLDLTADETRFLLHLSPLQRLDDLCGDEPDALWLGREWDETGYQRFTAATGTIPFVKGRAVSRYAVLDSFKEFVSDSSRALPVSVSHARLTWRDVSRRSQVRRMIATLLPAGCVTGNSLHVGYFKDDDTDKLHALLGIINSLPFEFQLRSKLGTGHVSLGSVREDGRIVCGYHGLVMGGDGRCVSMPGQRVRPTIRCYPVIERYGFVWV